MRFTVHTRNCYLRYCSTIFYKSSRTISTAIYFALASFFIASYAQAELPVPSHIVAPVGEHKGENVPQPIEFPHNTHVKDNKINCMYCHTYARRSKVAGIPPTSKCMGCHKMIATDKPRIQKLTEYWENGESPRWKKVHDVPDYVHFTHEKHIRKFVFDANFPVEDVQQVCGLCHGEIREMTVAEKTKPLNMGFCQRCHQANGGPGDCWKCHK
ncbi:MAG: cytochrome c family protein [Gammaproteobacteria bacterium]|nr:cytochrome c family protein [Gammaproteobacteria bacterium]